jgi:hypothetical protein
MHLHQDCACEAFLKWLHKFYTEHIEPRHSDLHPHLQEKLRALADAGGLEAAKAMFGAEVSAPVLTLSVAADPCAQRPRQTCMPSGLKLQSSSSSPATELRRASNILATTQALA